MVTCPDAEVPFVNGNRSSGIFNGVTKERPTGSYDQKTKFSMEDQQNGQRRKQGKD